MLERITRKLAMAKCRMCSADTPSESETCPECGHRLKFLEEELERPDKLLVDWKDDYNLGIPEVDEQHRHLAYLVNLLHDVAHRGHQRKGFIGDILKELDEYVVYHFKYEESIFRAAKYPRLREHHREHQTFSKSVNNLHVEYEKTGCSVNHALQFVYGWFIEHTQGSDRRFAEYWHRQLEKKNKGA